MLTVNDLINSKSNKKLNFFWGHTPKVEGVVDKSCLSNWYPASFKVGKTTYNCVEQYMMAQKAKLFKDDEHYNNIMQSTDPKKIKWYGRMVRGFEYQTWEDHKVKIVMEGCKAKFDQNPELKEYLMSVKTGVFVEASPYDRIWGIGLKETDDRAKTPAEWCGENLLGFILTEIRDGYKKEDKKNESK